MSLVIFHCFELITLKELEVGEYKNGASTQEKILQD